MQSRQNPHLNFPLDDPAPQVAAYTAYSRPPDEKQVGTPRMEKEVAASPPTDEVKGSSIRPDGPSLGMVSEVCSC